MGLRGGREGGRPEGEGARDRCGGHGASGNMWGEPQLLTVGVALRGLQVREETHGWAAWSCTRSA